jgi:hypothetical protein
MTTNEPSPALVPLAEWLDRVRDGLGTGPIGHGSNAGEIALRADLTLTTAERRLLLDLARIAAHNSERITAPLSTYLAGIALAGLSPEIRGERLAGLVRDLEAGLG